MKVLQHLPPSSLAVFPGNIQLAQETSYKYLPQFELVVGVTRSADSKYCNVYIVKIFRINFSTRSDNK